MLNNSKGFSLIELMVVVSILAVLAAIGVPEYQKYKRKSKQNEAKVQLVSIYTAQQMFKAKHRTYFPNLWAIGFEPHGLVSYRANFNTGVSTFRPVQGYTNGAYTPTGNADTYAMCGINYTGSNSGVSDKCKSLPVYGGTPTFSQIGTPRNSFVLTPSTFTVGTAHILQGANTGTSSDDKIDIWTMNHRKEVVNVVNGAL